MDSKSHSHTVALGVCKLAVEHLLYGCYPGNPGQLQRTSHTKQLELRVDIERHRFHPSRYRQVISDLTSGGSDKSAQMVLVLGQTTTTHNGL